MKIKTYDYVEMIINNFPMKISNSDTDLTPYGNNIFEKGNIKSLGKINLRIPYFIIKSNVCGQKSKSRYSSKGYSVVD